MKVSKRRPTVFAYPGRRNKAANPYNRILYDALEQRGWKVVDPGSLQGITGRADIVHVHWPQDRINQTFLVSVRRTLLFFATMAAQRMRGAKIVWTVHNVVSHQPVRPNAERRLMKLFVRLMSGFIVLNGATRGEAIERYPAMAKLPFAQIPHLFYGDAYPASLGKAEARAQFGLDPEARIVGFIGDLREYKGLERLVQAMLGTEPGAITCFVAGRFVDEQFAARIKAMIEEARSRGIAIVLLETRLSDEELVNAMVACDLLAFPYTNDSNSGLSLVAAERRIPMLFSNNAAFGEFCAAMQDPFSGLAQEDFSPRELVAAVDAAAKAGQGQSSEAFMHARSPEESARMTEAFYRELMG